jgi:hypothetical protein
MPRRTAASPLCSARNRVSPWRRTHVVPSAIVRAKWAAGINHSRLDLRPGAAVSCGVPKIFRTLSRASLSCYTLHFSRSCAAKI